MLLGLIVARVSQKSFGTFLRDEVFTPAGMAGAFVYESPGAAERRPLPDRVNALGYEKGQKGSWKASWGTAPARSEELLTVGDGGVWCSLEDMARWDAAVRAGKLLKPETMRRALTPSRTANGKTNNYGFGWTVFLDGSGRLTGYGHGGSWGGFRTTYHRDLASDRTTVLLSNRGDFNPGKFRSALDEAVKANLPAKW
jgi:CubicO group peptidase (beta-lactamase class C family)